ncbi:Tenascin-like protein [Spironucleus salmonicida]|uniref:Tenascin-like protein n=1 Tax=Spironucleus salmonicida TaxID=348837 RepID=A0A9P8LVK9_9EUKA|nr:Tenascin-like protein [Spironucleus salmonicida]
MTCSADTDCGKGECIDTVCACFQGYSGDQCASCASGFSQTAQGCLKNCTQLDCGRGFACTGGLLPAQAVCTCENANFDPAQRCMHCLEGFQPDNGMCVSDQCFNAGRLCSGHGICDSGCECFSFYTGETCNACTEDSVRTADGFCLRACREMNGKLQCPLFGSKCSQTVVPGRNVCVCEDKKSDLDHNCLTCQEGYSKTGEGCVVSTCVHNHTVCSGKGTCQNGSCACNADSGGLWCERCQGAADIMTNDGRCLPAGCVDLNSGIECFGNGSCAGGHGVCACNTGYSGKQCGDCGPGFKHYNGGCAAEACFQNRTDQEPCSSNGTCSQFGECECSGISGGSFCDECVSGFQKVSNGGCISVDCIVSAAQCNDKGFCIHINEDFRCLCQNGYSGNTNCVDCEEGYQLITGECISISCIGRASPLPCSGNGTCQVLDFVNDIEGCACQPGFIGRFCDDCDTEKGFSWTNNHTCANKACIGRDGYECAGNGECVHLYEQVFECRCQAGANGKFCHDCNEGFFKLREGKCVFESCISEAQECAGNGHCRQLGLSHRCICEGQFDSETNCKSCLSGYSLVGGRCQEGNGNKLSGGAIAGIVIGVLALLALIFLIVFVAMRRKPTGPSKAKSSVTKDTVGGQRFI